MAERAVKSSFVVNISSSVSAFQSSCTHRSLHISPQCLHPPAAGCHSTSIWLRKVNTGIFQPFTDCYSQTTYQHPNEDPVGILHNDPEVRVSSYQRTGTVCRMWVASLLPCATRTQPNCLQGHFGLSTELVRLVRLVKN